MSVMDLCFYVITVVWMHIATIGSVERWESPRFEEYFEIITENVDGNLAAYHIGSVPLIQVSVIIFMGAFVLFAYFFFKNLFKKTRQQKTVWVWISSLIYFFILYFCGSLFVHVPQNIFIFKSLKFPVSIIQEIVFFLMLGLFICLTFRSWILMLSEKIRRRNY